MSVQPEQSSKRKLLLLPRHLDDLRKSGLDDRQIAECGFHSLQAPASIQKALGWKKYNDELACCLAIPFFGRDGKPTGYVRLKPDKPRSKNGKPIKYEAPKGSTNHAYLPPKTRIALQDPITESFLFTEGEKKSAKADQEGFPCIGLTGVWSWQKKRDEDETGRKIGERELIDDLAAIKWNGVQIFIVFDSDAVHKGSIRRAEWHLAETLRRHGAIVKIVRLPDGESDANGHPIKVGLDDYLVAFGAEAFRSLVESATEPTAPNAADLGPNESADNPTRLAREYLESRCLHADGPILRRWNDEWYWWDGTAYQTMQKEEHHAAVHPFVQSRFEEANLWELGEWQKQVFANPKLKKPSVRKITGPLLASVDLALSAKTILPASRNQPFWIADNDDPEPSELLVCKNGMVHLPSLVTGKEYFTPSTPRLFSCNALSYEFTATAPPPMQWLAFLSQLWPNDAESIGLLQEWFGYMLTNDTSQQKIALIVGPKRSGKGTIARVLRHVIGEHNVAGPTLASLETNFGLWPLLGKSLAIFADARLSGRSDAAVVTERLLSISGEDALTIDRKNLQPVTTKVTARLMVLSNELPRLSDASGALAGRFLLLRLTRSFYGSEDNTLSERLIAELDGILLWAIEGWRRLNERRYFVQPETSCRMLGDLEDLSSPVGAFVKECCAIGPQHSTAIEEVYGRWCSWCAKNGRKEPGTVQTFGRDLQAAVPTLGDLRLRGEDGKRKRFYNGIAIIGL